MINVKLEKFEGPLGLLLKMIEKEEMDVTQISLANIADQYVEYIRKSDSINPEEMADFLLIASKLLLIKTRALLPMLYPEEDEEVDDLEKQLKMYKEFLDAAKNVSKLLGENNFMFAREFNRKVVMQNVDSFSPPKKLVKEDMHQIFSELLMRIKPPEKLGEKTIENKVTIDEKIADIKSMVLSRVKIKFSRILSNAKSKTEVIVSFLAALELMRQREVVLDQDEMFGEIIISCKEH